MEFQSGDTTFYVIGFGSSAAAAGCPSGSKSPQGAVELSREKSGPARGSCCVPCVPGVLGGVLACSASGARDLQHIGTQSGHGCHIWAPERRSVVQYSGPLAASPCECDVPPSSCDVVRAARVQEWSAVRAGRLPHAVIALPPYVVRTAAGPCLFSVYLLDPALTGRVGCHAIRASSDASLVPTARGASYIWARPASGDLEATKARADRSSASTGECRRARRVAGATRSELYPVSPACVVPAGSGTWWAPLTLNPPESQCARGGLLHYPRHVVVRVICESRTTRSRRR